MGHKVLNIKYLDPRINLTKKETRFCGWKIIAFITIFWYKVLVHFLSLCIFHTYISFFKLWFFSKFVHRNIQNLISFAIIFCRMKISNFWYICILCDCSREGLSYPLLFPFHTFLKVVQIKIKLNFYFLISLWCLKRFYEGL